MDEKNGQTHERADGQTKLMYYEPLHIIKFPDPGVGNYFVSVVEQMSRAFEGPFRRFPIIAHHRPKTLRSVIRPDVTLFSEI